MAPAGKLGELLVAQGVITSEQLRDAVNHRNTANTRLSSSLVQLGHVNEKVLATFFSKAYGFTAISLDGVKVPEQTSALVSREICEKHCAVPLMAENNRIAIAISDPTNASAVDDIRLTANREVDVYIATESSIKALIQRTYPAAPPRPLAPPRPMAPPPPRTGNTAVNIPVPPQQQPTEEKTGMLEVNLEDAIITDGEAANKPVIKFMNKVFSAALSRKTSDIHIEPYEKKMRVRLRVDGALHELMDVPEELRASVPARLKVMANLDISEKRLPQDGRLSIKTKTKKIDIRVSTLPTIYGEKVVMRILDSGSSTPDLKQMGLEPEQLTLLRAAAQSPYGMVLVTGPTGSGKSTTLYAALAELNTPDVNISTVEDPVEFNMPGINQTQAKEDIGMTFAATLRSLLRQDPDIILVGEIRDQETAEIAIKASLTGHLVFSTLHTNDAPSAVTRLLHMGVEPFLITASLNLVQAQRLIRKVCENCKAEDKTITRDMLIAAEVAPEWLDKVKPVKGAGCDRCGNSGYKGRVGVYELMPMTENLRNLVIKGANADEIRIAAMKDGMITLRTSALLKFYRGLTTLEEVLNCSKPNGKIE